LSAKSDPPVFFDIDTQVDFMRPEGSLYIPGAEEIIPNLQALMNWARENDVPVISSADAHAPDDPEFKRWPPHCVIGTPGQRRIPETTLLAPVVVPCRAGGFAPPVRWAGQYIVEKATYSPEDNPNFAAMLRALGPRRAVVFGVATEFCVRAAALALCRHGFRVELVTDAMRAITPEGGRKALEEMAAAGACRVTTAEVVRPNAIAPSPSGL